MALSVGKAALVVAGAAAIVFAPTRRNLALHKPVKASSVRLGHPSSLVNGAVEWGSYGLHTQTQHPAHVTIDLEGTHRLGEVRVFGRGDGFHVDTAPRVIVKTSVDGRSFTYGATCDGLPMQASPCRVDLGGVTARYVRLEDTFLVLSEIEVFEAR
jgi:hypothetical protein